MNKLIELLNQYEKERKSWWTWRSIDSYDNCVYWVDCDWETEITMYSDLYSKYYWFIKWLVDNDKIDFDKVNKVYYKNIYCWTDWKYISYAEFLDEEILIMRLSIQDNPIEFLCSVLK